MAYLRLNSGVKKCALSHTSAAAAANTAPLPPFTHCMSWKENLFSCPAVLRGLWPSNTLLPGTSIDSSATIDKVNFLQVDVGPGQQVRVRSQSCLHVFAQHVRMHYMFPAPAHQGSNQKSRPVADAAQPQTCYSSLTPPLLPWQVALYSQQTCSSWPIWSMMCISLVLATTVVLLQGPPTIPCCFLDHQHANQSPGNPISPCACSCKVSVAAPKSSRATSWHVVQPSSTSPTPCCCPSRSTRGPSMPSLALSPSRLQTPWGQQLPPSFLPLEAAGSWHPDQYRSSVLL